MARYNYYESESSIEARKKKEKEQRLMREEEERKEKELAKKRRNMIVGSVFTGIIIFAALIFLYMCLEKIKPGYIGVVYSVNGGVTGKVFDQGWHWKKPTEHVVDYSIGIEQSYLTATKDGDSPKDDSFSAPSSDGKGLQMELTFTYRYREQDITDTFVHFKGRSGADILSTFIKPNVISWTKEVTAKYPVTDILGEKRAELNGILSKYLAEKFSPYGIIIDNASLINIDVDDETRAAITKKVTAQQELELANIESQTAQINAEKERQVAVINANKEKESALINAERDKEVAQINAEKLKIQAEGEAAAKIIEAEAEAEANNKIAASLTPELIEKLKYESWNGELPQVQGSGTPILDFRSE